MSRRPLLAVTVRLDTIVGGGQTLGTLDDGRKMFVWGGLPGETVTAQMTKKKSRYAEGIVTDVISASDERVTPRDPESYLSTSPWQIMSFEAENRYKAALVSEAFTLHGVTLPHPVDIYTDGREYHYRNKVEFSWYGDATSGVETLHLAFFRRGTKGKIIVDDCALLPDPMMNLARTIRDALTAAGVSARQLKTLLIRCDQSGNCVWQLYVKDTPCDFIHALDAIPAMGGEVIYSNPKSPASVITERLTSFGDITLSDTVLGVPFRYATEGFFQINLPVYEQALRDMKEWVTDGSHASKLPETSAQTRASSEEGSWSDEDCLSNASSAIAPESAEIDARRAEAVSDNFAGEDTSDGSGRKFVVDLYSGVGTIGLTIGGDNTTLVEINEHAVREMQRNIAELGIAATPVLAASEQALEYITGDKTIIVDPPRAGLHDDVIQQLLAERPGRIIYLSCNPVTQARDVAKLAGAYTIRAHQGYNFFPRTPHIEHLVILDRR